jgi:hypothetical protein
MPTAPALVAIALLLITAMPRAQSPPLPDQDAFFAEVRKRLASNDRLMSRFSYRERSTELMLNPFGRMGTGPERVFEVYPHPEDHLTYRRLVEDNGRTLPREELAEQDRAYLSELEEWKRRLDREGQSEREERRRKAEESLAKDQALAREALDMFTFTMVGRDTWEGSPAIVIAFEARPDAQPRTREGRVARAFSGRAWVHETEYEVMHVAATATDDVSFGWGVIARLHRGSEVRFTRRRVAGVWLPAETSFDGTGRAILVRKVTIHFRRTYYDYRPFDASELPARLAES